MNIHMNIRYLFILKFIKMSLVVTNLFHAAKGRIQKKKITENSIKVGGWGQHGKFFHYFFLNMSLKHLKLPKNHFKTNLFFQFLVGETLLQ